MVTDDCVYIRHAISKGNERSSGIRQCSTRCTQVTDRDDDVHFLLPAKLFSALVHRGQRVGHDEWREGRRRYQRWSIVVGEADDANLHSVKGKRLALRPFGWCIVRPRVEDVRRYVRKISQWDECIAQV